MFGQAALIAALKGQTLRIPSLAALFHAWPAPSLNPHYQDLVAVASSAILRVAAAAPHLRIERRLRDDIALLACLWWPGARRPQMDALVLFAVWVVCWDDTVDANEGDLAADVARADEWRAKTLQITRNALNLHLPDAVTTTREAPVDAINAVLVDFGRLYNNNNNTTTEGDRQRLYDQVSTTIGACATEQRMNLDDAMPTFDEYMALREGTIGGGMLCALVPFAMGRAVPAELLDSPPARVLRKQVNVLFGLVNDVLSLKKELQTGCVINAVCTLFTPQTSLDEVMAQIVQMLRDGVRRFDEAAGELIDQCINDVQLQSLARDLIDGYRAIVTGTLEFT